MSFQMERYELNQVIHLINAILIAMTHSEWNGSSVDSIHIARNIIPSHARLQYPMILTSEYQVHFTLIQFLLPHRIIHLFTLQIGAVVVRHLQNVHTDTVLRYIVRARAMERPKSRLVVSGPSNHHGQWHHQVAWTD